MSKRSATNAELDAAVALFERLPIELVSKILIDLKALRLGAVAVNKATRDKILKATQLPGFHRALTLRCFPETTRLPFDAQHLLDRGYLGPRKEGTERAWRLHLARMIGLLRSFTLGIYATSPEGNGVDGVVRHHIHNPQTCDDVTKKLRFEAFPAAFAYYAFASFGANRRRVNVRIGHGTGSANDSWFKANMSMHRGIVDVVEYTVEASRMSDADVDQFIADTYTFVQPLPSVVALSSPLIKVYVRSSSFGNSTHTMRKSDRLTNVFAFNQPREARAIFRFKYGDRSVILRVSALNRIEKRDFGRTHAMEATLGEVLPPDVREVTVDTMMF